MDLIVIVSLIILTLASVIFFNKLKNNRKNDSALRRRAVFNAVEMMTFTRLKEVLPEANVLAHVSFDALLTTKYLHTRLKYQKMFADFVVLDKNCKVIAIIALDDSNVIKRMKQQVYQDALLESAGYRMVRYSGVPEYQQLREDFLTEFIGMNQSELEHTINMGKSSDLYLDGIGNRIRVFS